MRRLLALSWLHFLNDGAANFLPGILPAVLLTLHKSPAMASVMMSALMIGQAVQPTLGWLADRVGGRGFILWSLVGSSTGAIFMGIVPNFWLLILVLILIGLSNSGFHPQALAAARHLSGPKNGLSMAIFLVGGELGRGIWPLLASLVVLHWGMQNLWVLAVAAFISMAFLRRSLPQLPRRKEGTRIHWKHHVRPASALVAFTLLRALIIMGLVTYLPLSSSIRGGSLLSSASLVSVLLIVGIVGNVGSGILADKLDRRKILGWSSLGVAVLLSLELLLPSRWHYPVLAVLGIMVFASLPITVLIGQDIFPENPSMGSGIALGLANGFGAILLLGLGILSAWQGIDSALWGVVVVAVISVPIAALLPEPPESRRVRSQ